VTDEEKIIAALRALLSREVTMTSSTHLRDDLNLDSASLVELTVLVHTMYGVDLGRRAAEHNVLPNTVGDLTLLLGMP
jgi:acyl carrier protein